MSKSRLGSAAALIVTAVLGVHAASASATTFACQYFGSTFFLNPAMQLTSGSGVYNWNARGQCSLDGGDLQPASLSSDGSYNSVVCGTNDMTGTARVTVGSQTLSFTYTSNVVAFNGVLRGIGDTTGSGAMAFRLSTQSHVGPIPTCTDKLDFVGAFTGSI